MTDEQYKQLLDRCSSPLGPSETLLKALSPHEKRSIVQYQSDRGLPVLGACVTRDLTKWIKAQKYVKGYTNRNRTATYLIKSDNPTHSRAMVRDVPIRRKYATDQPGVAMKACGRQLISIVEQSGLSQNEFARRTGIPQPTLSDLKQGKTSLTVNTLARYFEQAGYKVLGFILEPLPTLETVTQTKRRTETNSAII